MSPRSDPAPPVRKPTRARPEGEKQLRVCTSPEWRAKHGEPSGAQFREAWETRAQRTTRKGDPRTEALLLERGRIVSALGCEDEPDVEAFARNLRTHSDGIDEIIAATREGNTGLGMAPGLNVVEVVRGYVTREATAVETIRATQRALGCMPGENVVDVAKRSRADVEAAAGELLLPIPEPGSATARLMIANSIMRRERDEARNAPSLPPPAPTAHTDLGRLREAAERAGIDVNARGWQAKIVVASGAAQTAVSDVAQGRALRGKLLAWVEGVEGRGEATRKGATR